jgi:hypothetical protein
MKHLNWERHVRDVIFEYVVVGLGYYIQGYPTFYGIKITFPQNLFFLIKHF